MKKIYYISLIIILFLQPVKIAYCTEIEKENINSISQDLIIVTDYYQITNLIEVGIMIWVNDRLFYNTFMESFRPLTPIKLFGAGFKYSSPYVELYWSHDLLNMDFFEIQYSPDNILWNYLGQNITTEYKDNSVNNETERYYRVRACKYIHPDWYNSTFSHMNFEIVYFIMGGEGIVISPDNNEWFIALIFICVPLLFVLGIVLVKRK